MRQLTQCLTNKKAQQIVLIFGLFVASLLGGFLAGYVFQHEEACAQCVQLPGVPPLSGGLGYIGDYCGGGGLCNPRPDTAVLRGNGGCTVAERGQFTRRTAETAEDWGNYVTTDGLYFCACGTSSAGTECAWVGIQSVPQD